jgi:hypothetical protein
MPLGRRLRDNLEPDRKWLAGMWRLNWSAEASGVRNLTNSLSNVVAFRSEHRMPWQRYDVRNREGIFLERHWS